MGECRLEVQNLGKAYRIARRERYRSLREELAEAGTAVCQTLAMPWRSLRKGVQSQAVTGEMGADGESADLLWALDDVSFTVQSGEVVGIIGPNGAGKTTLFKILSRITQPTKGHAVVRGRVGSLLEVGTGFHPELTGRENIYLSGIILGMRREEIARKFDEILEFAGVQAFLDTPVKRYSSGMYVRLAFAVAAHLEPEILLVDEVLAVGDAAFQQKCLGKMGQVARSGRTILFVSHNMSAIKGLCSRALLFEGGRLTSDGPVETVVLNYLAGVNGLAASGCMDFRSRTDRVGSGSVRLTSFQARATDSQTATPRTGAGAELTIGYESREDFSIPNLQVIATVHDGSGDSIFMCMPALTSLREFRDLPQAGAVVCRIYTLPLIPGHYSVSLTLKIGSEIVDSISHAAAFEVVDGGESGLSVLPSGRWGKIVVPHEWELAAVGKA